MVEVKTYYKIARSIVFTALIAVAVLYVGIYVLLSVPAVQNKIRDIAEKEASVFLGSDVRIGSVDIFPFNEARLHDVAVDTPGGEKCITIKTVGAGIHLWRLVSEGKIEITYAEILGLDGRIWQKEKDGDLNIKFIIDAFAPKDKNKPPAKFDLRIHNIVVRKSSLSFDRLWKPEKVSENVSSPDHIHLTDLKADIALPVLKNDDFTIDLRRLSFKEDSGIDLRRLSLKTHITPTSVSFSDFLLNIGESVVRIGDNSLRFKSFKDIKEAMSSGNHSLNIIGENLRPRDFRAFSPFLDRIGGIYYLDLAVSGNYGRLDVSNFELRDNDAGMKVKFSGLISDLSNISNMEADVDQLEIKSTDTFNSMIIDDLPGLKPEIKDIIRRLGDVEVFGDGSLAMASKRAEADLDISTTLGNLLATVSGESSASGVLSGTFRVTTSDFDIATLVNSDELGNVGLEAEGELSLSGKEFDGKGNIAIDHIDIRNNRLSNITADIEKVRKDISGIITIDDPLVSLVADGEAYIDGASSCIKLDAGLRHFIPSAFGLMNKYQGYNFHGNISADISGNNLDNVSGTLCMSDLRMLDDEGHGLRLDSFDLSIDKHEEERELILNTDFMSARANGNFKVKSLVATVDNILASSFPSYFGNRRKDDSADDSSLTYSITIQPIDRIIDFFHLPVRPLTDVRISGNINGKEESLSCVIDAPYILQGTNKLISGNRADLSATSIWGSRIMVNTTVPVKNDRAQLELSLNAFADKVGAELGWQAVNNQEAIGKVSMDAEIIKDETTGRPAVDLAINSSSFRLGDAEWKIDPATISCQEKRVNINDLRIWHNQQFISIQGTASSEMEDEVIVNLAEIDLEYIFDILNINYVTFGGIATGTVAAQGVFTKEPIAETKKLTVKNLAYNNAVLGDGELFSRWNNEEKEVEIHADIRENDIRRAKIDGGIYVTRDSLSFDMIADKVDIAFLKPFMSAFTSDVGGRASGDLKLFGTFKDIDLVGKAFADSISLKVDYTNVYYHGTDSVYLNPGKIVIPEFTLYDKYGNTGVLTGYVKHRYFHDPEFEFKISKARNLLCYDTNAGINPDWYGTIFASGNGTLRGRPGIVTMMMDMTTAPKSDFTFVLNETQTAIDYTFLTFSDRRKEMEQEKIEVKETIEDKYLKKNEEEEGLPSVFAMDLRATITPEAKMNLIMDPKAGDKIVAHGGGPLQISYDTESDEMKMFGKYTLTEGNYNFSLQELILRDFKIKEGSNISFNGDPLAAHLDIQAAYRVNTNLSDLDKSFSTDRDLNRTNVPVDALLNVRGDLQNPDITFDISLPTLTSDVERKVRSIISTEDMMNRQIIYLLALNRFYTPEYMGIQGNGGEFASVASSTLSSQLSNIIGSLTDKVSVAPSFRSDKGDFSDMEVDLSLSSRLLNNRLLINGNFGYRDRSTSQTTFVGDFDIEYLLSRNGNLRLKAYNHFNDQNYYLKSALTTQGIGVVYRREFDNPFTFLRRKKKAVPANNPDEKIGDERDSDNEKGRKEEEQQ